MKPSPSHIRKHVFGIWIFCFICFLICKSWDSWAVVADEAVVVDLAEAEEEEVDVALAAVVVVVADFNKMKVHQNTSKNSDTTPTHVKINL